MFVEAYVWHEYTEPTDSIRSRLPWRSGAVFRDPFGDTAALFLFCLQPDRLL